MLAADGVLARTRRMIVEHPFAAVGLAFGIAYVAMRIVRVP